MVALMLGCNNPKVVLGTFSVAAIMIAIPTQEELDLSRHGPKSPAQAIAHLQVTNSLQDKRSAVSIAKYL
jgi:hypothetical protein